jgi:hypothetical protein
MKKVEIAEAQQLLADYVRNPVQAPVILTLNGKPLAVVLAAEGADEETLSLSCNPRFWEIMERSCRRMDKEGGISSNEVRRRLGLPPFEEKRSPAKKRKTGKANGQKPGPPPKLPKIRKAAQ